jgi:hypothetical protein
VLFYFLGGKTRRETAAEPVEPADPGALHRRPRDRHDGNRPRCRHHVRRQPAAAP